MRPELNYVDVCSQIMRCGSNCISCSSDCRSEEGEEGRPGGADSGSLRGSQGSEEDANVVAKLAEARRTSFIRGRWVYADDSQESQYSVVHSSACLPANGEYSAFTAWSKF